jgi:RimJ/RimL family protein N-acetyltransferase
MGWFLFRPCRKDPDNIKRIELGYRLKRVYWGQGYATEVAKELIAKGFAELGVDEVFAVTMKTNLGSQAVMRKAGLTFVREFQNPEEPDSDIPEVEYAIVRGN